MDVNPINERRVAERTTTDGVLTGKHHIWTLAVPVSLKFVEATIVFLVTLQNKCKCLI